MISRSAADVYLIGAGIHDITGPAAEVGMMGYAMVDQRTTGIQTRLHSRAFIIGDTTTGQRVVFVSAELGVLSQGIKQQIAARVLADPELAPFYNDANILLSATHTHNGPGGYSHYALYNLTILGYCKQNFNVIVEGIYQSIRKAHRNITTGNIYLNTGEVSDAGWNRSPVAYANNPAAERDRYAANTDKLMTTLRLVSLEGNELGMISWYAIHPTSVGNTNKLITSDNLGYAAYLFERDKGTDYLADKTFVGAYAQANSADVSPNIYWGYPDGVTDYDHMRIVGARLYLKAKELYGANGTLVSGTVDFRHSYVNMMERLVSRDWIQDRDGDVRTCAAAIGTPMLAGSTEDGKGVDWFHEGMVWGSGIWPEFTLVPGDQACHAEKIIALPMGRMKPYPWTPEVLPVQILKIGNLAIVALPFECTTMSGRRIRETVMDRLADIGVTNVVVSGLSNAYHGYVTTREEYAVQHYEGASNHFGPYALNAYQQEYDRLALAMETGADVDRGPAPRNLINAQNTLLTDVVFDTVPLFKSFGGIVANASASYQRGQTASVTFWGAHPKNDLKIQSTYLVVERLAGSAWTPVARDWDPETRFIWARSGISDSKITIQWTIPQDAAPGTYRIRHFGTWKSILGYKKSYEGSSRSFAVN